MWWTFCPRFPTKKAFCLIKFKKRLYYVNIADDELVVCEPVRELVCRCIRGCTPTAESGFKCQYCDEPFAHDSQQKELCAFTPNKSTVSLKINSISSTA